MAIDFVRFKRVLGRCAEVANDPTVKPIVKMVYEGRLAARAAELIAAHDAMPAVEGALVEEANEAREHLRAFDQPYREARAALLAFAPHTVVPETLKAQPTDTDRQHAIASLLDAVDDHAGQPWADQLLAGEFGQKASLVMQEIDEAVTASKALSAARERRSAAYGPAYEAYLAFKNLVRNAYGPKSMHYRRIHLRADGTLAGDGDAGGGGGGGEGGGGDGGGGGPPVT